MPNLSAWSPRALAILRIVAGLLFLEHATMKFLHFPAPLMPGQLPPMFIAAGVIEATTSTLITLGLFTRAAALIASGEMAVGYFMIHLPQGFWPTLNKGEAAILFCFIFLYIACAGPGAWSLDGARKTSSAS
jgi:putative oxidoreductase